MSKESFQNDNICNNCGQNPLETPLYSNDFSELLQVSYEYLTKQQEIMQEEYGLGDYDHWFYDSKTGFLTFSDEGVDKIKIKYEETGTLSKTSNTWLWSWANESIPSNVKSEITQVKKFGEIEAYEPLMKAQWDADMTNAWEMTIVAAYLMNAKGAYRVPTEKLYSFMIFKEVIDLRGHSKD